MAKAKRGSSVKKGLKFFVFGEAGTWKSSFSLDFMRMKSEEGNPLKVFYIDCETGSIDNYLSDLEAEGIDLDNLFIIYTTSYTEVEEWIQKAIDNEELYFENDDGDIELAIDAEGNPFIADVIVVDGLTVISDNVKFATINVSEKRAGLRLSDDATSREREVAVANAGLEFKDHDKMKMKGKALLRNMITGTDKYVCVTAREKIERKMLTGADGKMQLTDVGVIPDTWKGTEYEFYTVLRTFEDEDDGEIKAQIMRKDRTKVFMQNEIIDHPTPRLWQSVIDDNKGKKSTVVSGSYDDDLKKDEQSIRKENNDNKKSNKQKSSTKVKSESTSLETIEDYRKAIEAKVKLMDKKNKLAVKPSVVRAGLEPNPNNIDNIDDLKKFYEIVSK